MWNWLPWKQLLRRSARRRGFIDPITLLARLERFAQPSEIAVPGELLRAGIAFHARGLLNTRVIQHNLDWIWPFWVERQFNPRDDAFIPRAYSITHVNLTHRNWTAVGLPGCNAFPIVDPRGLVTPFFDGWSLDAWLVTESGHWLIPSRASSASQQLLTEDGIAVRTETQAGDLKLAAQVDTVLESDRPLCRLQLRAASSEPGWLVVSVRPYNPEGVSFVDAVTLEAGSSWIINGRRCIRFSQPVDHHAASQYREGDVTTKIPVKASTTAAACDVGMTTAAALFRVEPGAPRELTVLTDLSQDRESAPLFPSGEPPASWSSALEGTAQLRVPDPLFQSLYDVALRTVILHSPLDVYPGPYGYKRFWYRDAAFIAEAMLEVGLLQRAERVLDRFPLRQRRNGYFASQEGEWDSNGEALWILHRFCELTGRSAKDAWHTPIIQGARWLISKRLPDGVDALHAGLLPPGFSAEHFGPNDYYYWDDFWAVAGLHAASALTDQWGNRTDAQAFTQGARDYNRAIERSLARSTSRRVRPGIPASPYRRMDSGAIGCLVPSYPLRLWPANDRRITDTAEFLLAHCIVDGAFFQDMIHSGLNAYLTLHLAQTLLRAGDARFFDLVEAVARLATPTGQWPEAIHVRTKGGCMGDGQHVWASAEWLCIIRQMFVREEADRLILGSGLPSRWLEPGQEISFGPTPTPYGPLTVFIHAERETITLRWAASWRGTPPVFEVRVRGTESAILEKPETLEVTLRRQPQKNG